MMPETPTRIALAVALFVLIAVAWRVGTPRAVHDRLSERFIRGVPWGTALTVVVVIGFYLFAQSGLSNPREPVVYAFVSWSYLYPTGIFTAGIAHGGPDHIVSNMSATLVLAPIAEYVWSHYPRSEKDESGAGLPGGFARRVVTDGGREEPTQRETDRGGVDGTVDDRTGLDRTGDDGNGGLLSRPWIRAIVVFPAVLFAIAFVTAAFSLGPGLGFSGAVFAIVGFAVVTRPLATVVGVLTTSALGILFSAFTRPVIRETIATGPPTPPGWAGVGFQAHLLGFLIGVLLAAGLFAARDERPPAGRVLGATLVVGLVQSVWLITGGGGEEFVQYRGAGVTFLLALVIVITVAVAGRREPLRNAIPVPDRLAASAKRRLPSGRRMAWGWLFVVIAGTSIAAIALLVTGEPPFVSIGGAAFLALLLIVPAVHILLPARIHDGPLSRRGGATLLLVLVTILASIPMVVFGLLVVDDPTIEGSEGVEIRDYTVAYVDDEPSPQTTAVDLGVDPFATRTDGVVVTSDDREIWTVAERPAVLAHEGNGTVVVGGVGWRETVAVDRDAWDVVGGEEAYAVDLEHDDRQIRSYVSDGVTAGGELDGRAFTVVPTEDGFAVDVEHDGETADTTAVPSPGESATVGEFTLRTESGTDDENGAETLQLFVEGERGELLLAERTD